MRHALATTLLGFSMLALIGCVTPANAPFIARDAVMESARRVSERYASTWNAGDLESFGALYSAEARHVTLSGEFLRGRQAIVNAHRVNRERYPANVRMATRLEGARAITDDTIVAVMIVEYANMPNAPDGLQAARLTLTLARRSGDWLVAQAHASPSR